MFYLPLIHVCMHLSFLNNGIMYYALLLLTLYLYICLFLFLFMTHKSLETSVICLLNKLNNTKIEYLNPVLGIDLYDLNVSTCLKTRSIP